MCIRKMFRYAFPFVLIMSAVSLPAAAATLPLSLKGFICGSEDAEIHWLQQVNTSGILGKYFLGAEVLSARGLEVAGIVAQPQTGVVGFRKFTSYVRIISPRFESEKHSVVQFRFRLSDNSLYVPTKRLSDLGVDGTSDLYQQITVLADGFDKDISSATLENVALYVMAGGTEGLRNIIWFGDITIESQTDVFRPEAIFVDVNNVAGCEAIGGSVPGGGLGGGNGGSGGGNRIRQRLLQLKDRLKQRQNSR